MPTGIFAENAVQLPDRVRVPCKHAIAAFCRSVFDAVLHPLRCIATAMHTLSQRWKEKEIIIKNQSPLGRLFATAVRLIVLMNKENRVRSTVP